MQFSKEAVGIHFYSILIVPHDEEEQSGDAPLFKMLVSTEWQTNYSEL